MISPVVLASILVVLLFIVVVLQSRVQRFRRDVHRLKADFTGFRRDMQIKVCLWFIIFIAVYLRVLRSEDIAP